MPYMNENGAVHVSAPGAQAGPTGPHRAPLRGRRFLHCALLSQWSTGEKGPMENHKVL